ncbi:hypothetical protein ScPMuIL_017954 [Solemya velum]
MNLLNCFNELIGKTQFSKRVGVMVSSNSVNILFQIIVQEFEDQTPCEDFMMLAHQILSKIGQKDRKFATKARLNRGLLVTLSLIKNNANNFKILRILLPVFKLYSNNSVNASYLGKHNSIPSIFRVIQQCGRKHSSVLKLAMEILSNLTKSRNNAARTIGGDYIPNLLALYSDLHQTDTKHRHVSIRKAILNILKNVTSLKSGKKALTESNGIEILYDCAQEVVDCREMESLMILASIIMRKCCPRNKLPLPSIMSTLSFDRPISELYPDTQQDSMIMGFVNFVETADSDNSSLEDDDDIDSDDEKFKTDNTDEVEEDREQGGAPQSYRRGVEDLRMYDEFFPELFEIELVNSESQKSGYISPGLLSSQRSNADSGRDSASSSGSKISCYGSSILYDSDYIDSTAMCEGATAVNLKTGSNIFSLDVQLPSQTSLSGSPTKSPPRKQNQQKQIKLPKKGARRSQKDKKSAKKYSIRTEARESDITEALSITPLPVLRDSMDDLIKTGFSSDDEDLSSELYHDPLLFQVLARETKSIYKFEKLAHPDLCSARAPPFVEPFYHRKFGVQRSKVFEDIDRLIHSENLIDQIIYDLDAIVSKAGMSYSQPNAALINRDQYRLGAASRLEALGPACLRFNAQFECGNLRRVVWVREYEYDLILNPDINANSHHQWFYFEVSNMTADVPYRFNIINCEKLNSQFNFGMKPVIYSVTEAMEGRPYWCRTGYDICYYRNHFSRSAQATGGVKGKTYYTTTFTIKFAHSKDICYLAYHYPYTYTTLMTHINMWDRRCDQSQVFFREQTLCTTLAGNAVPVMTITAQPKSFSKEHVEELRDRPYIFLSGRVHPGECNASWVMKGTVDFLLSKKPVAQLLRESFIFKIVPMLNPDGVINGNHRCSLAGEDLNRRWDNPCPRLHPTIFHSKGLLQYLQMINKTPLVYCDYHGHSRKKNIFLYGCSSSQSWIPNDTQNPACTGNKAEDNGYKTLPRVLHTIAHAFSWPNCSFVLEKSKETTARVVVWRQIGVIRSYTMESTYCGMDRDGKYKDTHISTKMLEEMGQKFAEALLRILPTGANNENPSLQPACYGSQPNLELFGVTAEDRDETGDGFIDLDNDLCAKADDRVSLCGSDTDLNTSDSSDADLEGEDGIVLEQ